MSTEQILIHRFENGAMLPVISLGTWQLEASDPQTPEAVKTALDCGYRGIDTAFVYGNEKLIGGIVQNFDVKSRKTFKPIATKKCGKFELVDAAEFKSSFAKPHGPVEDDREIFVTSKIWVSAFSYEKVRAQAEEHLRNFNRKSADLMLLHFPGCHVAFGDSREEMTANQDKVREECWRALEDLYAEGKIRVIGVSNYMVKHMEPLIKSIKARQAAGDKKAMIPMVNQIRINAIDQASPDIEKLCVEHNILITSYSSLGSPSKVKANLENPALKKIAGSHGVSVASVLLRWCMQRGYSILPRSSKVARVPPNLIEPLSFHLSDQEVDEINGMKTESVPGDFSVYDIN